LYPGLGHADELPSGEADGEQVCKAVTYVGSWLGRVRAWPVLPMLVGVTCGCQQHQTVESWA